MTCPLCKKTWKPLMSGFVTCQTCMEKMRAAVATDAAIDERREAAAFPCGALERGAGQRTKARWALLLTVNNPRKGAALEMVLSTICSGRTFPARSPLPKP